MAASERLVCCKKGALFFMKLFKPMKSTRRSLLKQFAATASASMLATLPQAHAQTAAPKAHFGMEDVVARAKALSESPFQDAPPPLPKEIANLDFDTWRSLRFNPSKAFLADRNGAYRLELFHLGHLFKRPVVVNIVHDGIVAPIPYSPSLFEMDRLKLKQVLPVGLGFAGFRLHTHLNDPQRFDELIAFLGASYFRFLGRDQHYGLSCRAIAVNAGTDQEEFPFFKEFWVNSPAVDAARVTVYGLLDGASVTGAVQMEIYPGMNTVVDVHFTLFTRRDNVKLGFAPLTSMFLNGENDHRIASGYRPQLHDSDGLLMHSGHGEWIWRALRNPAKPEISSFMDQSIKGFGLLQRERAFSAYQDIDLAYQNRPSYWVEPHGDWGKGRVELIELPTADESNDNIVASFVPEVTPAVGKPFNFSYQITATRNMPHLSPGGRAIHTFVAPAAALGAKDPAPTDSTRFIIDFADGDLAFYLHDPALLKVMASASNGKILRTAIEANPAIGGFRANVDVQVPAGQAADVRVFLQAGARTLTETWTFPFAAI